MNEKWRVLTYRDYDFEDNGRQVTGRTLHCYRPSSNPAWHGVEYAKLQVPADSEAFQAELTPGKEYILGFNRFGKVVEIIPADEA